MYKTIQHWTIPQTSPRLPIVQRAAGAFLHLKEGNHGRSHMTFLQDTLVALFPKLLVSRSGAELSEVGYLEILESMLIYYSVPLVGGPVFNRLFGALLPKDVDRSLLTKSISEISAMPNSTEKLRHILPAKLGIIASALALTGIGGEYIINYSRNLMTAQVFKKDKFSDVVNLSKGNIQSSEKSSIVEHSRKRIYQVIGVCAGIFGASLLGVLTARVAPKAITNGMIKGPLTSIARFFDFQYKDGSYGLTKNQMGTYMALSVPAYMDAARDKLETWETATRLSIVLPYLLWGQDWLEGLIREKFPHIITPVEGDKNGANRVLTFEEVLQRSQNEQRGSVAALGKEAYSATLGAPFKEKLLHAGIPLAVGIFGTGLGVGMLNRFFTKRRFEQTQQQQEEERRRSRLYNTPLPEKNLPQAAALLPKPTRPANASPPARPAIQPKFQQQPFPPTKPYASASSTWSAMANPPNFRSSAYPPPMRPSTPYAYPIHPAGAGRPWPSSGIRVG